ncbi:MAG: YfiR family protein, partial [Bryobacteraceae bacterium]
MEQVRGNGLESRKAPPGWPVVRSPAIMMCLMAGLGLSAQRASRAADAPLEYQVKAAFLLNFTKFVEWPAAAFAASDSPIAICVLGDDPFGGALDQIVEGEVVNGRKLVIQRV